MIGMCTVYATGDIYLPDECSLGQCVLHAGGIIHLPKKYDIGEKCTMKQKMADPLKPYSFFEIKQIGIDLEGRVLNAKIMVNLIDKTSPFHELLKAHDHITHVDGVAITTVEDTRKLFRSGYAKGYTTVTRLREGKSAEVKVSYFDK